MLDQKPESFIEFEKMISDKNWIYKLGDDAEASEREAILAELNKHMGIDGTGESVGEEKEDGGQQSDLALAGKMDQDQALLNSILEFNSAMYDGAGAASNVDNIEPMRPTTADAANLTFLETRLTKKPRKKIENPAYTLKGVKFKSRKNPAVLNVSTAAFQELLNRHNMNPAKQMNKSRSTSALRLGSDGRATYAETGGSAEQEAIRRKEILLGAAGGVQPPKGGEGGGGGDALPLGVKNAEDLLNLDKETLVALLLQERFANTDTTPRPVSADAAAQPQLSARRPSSQGQAEAKSGSGGPLSTGGLDTVPENAPVIASLDKPPTPSRIGSGGQSKVVLDPIEIPTSPIKPASRPASSSGLSLLSKSMDGAANMDMNAPATAFADDTLLVGAEPKVATTSALQTAVNKDGRSTPGAFLPTPTGSRPGTGAGVTMSKSMSTSSLSDKRANDAKKGGKGLTGLNISGQMGTTGSLSKARIAEIRSLRDYMMTVSGAFAMNVNPEASPSAQAEVAESIAVTKDMVKETVRKNRVDQTWTLFSTPGYYEAVGPKEIFKSDVHKNFIQDDKFDKAVRNADKSLGIKRDALRVWSEDGVKNKINLFASGGAMKT